MNIMLVCFLQEIFGGYTVTDNYGYMVIDNRLRTNDIKKKVFWYKAKNRKKFKIGSRKFNKFHNANPKYDRRGKF